MNGDHRGSVVALVVASAIMAAVVGACGQSGAATPSATASGVTVPPTPAALASPTPAASIAVSTEPTPSSSPVPSGDVAVDLALLDHVPTAVDGVAVEPDPATSAEVAADPSLSDSASALAIALAIAAGSSVADDLAIVSVVRLRPGVFDDGFFRSWRDSYDAAACAAAGGVSGHAETEIAGRTTYIGTCGGGAHTYHVMLETDDAVLVSVTAVGERRLGEQVVAGLTE